LCAVAAFALLGLPTAAHASHGCTDGDDGALPLTLTVAGEPATGSYALPATTPTGLVAFAHGYGHTSQSWTHHMSRVARELGVIAVAMDYRGTALVNGTWRGWRVSEGAADTIAAAQHFETACAADLAGKPFVDFGVSMGGNTSGLIAAAGAKRSTGAPLFDYWVDVEGATNVLETYHEASALAPVNAFAANAKADIEAEMGGTFADKSAVYQERAVVTRADDIAASGIKGVVLVHGLDDGLVPYNQSREMAEALWDAGVGYDFFTVGRRDAQSEQDTTITGTIIGNVKPDYVSPFAGHASEKSTTNIIMRQSFAALNGIYQGSQPATNCRGEYLIDGPGATVNGGRSCEV
jgi:predicted alpha/beta-hydrolase family hydrolase